MIEINMENQKTNFRELVSGLAVQGYKLGRDYTFAFTGKNCIKLNPRSDHENFELIVKLRWPW